MPEYVRTEGFGRNAVIVSRLTPEEIQEWQKKNAKGGIIVKPLTKETYMGLKEERMPDSKIAKEHGMNSMQMTNWRKENLTVAEQEKTRLKKGVKAEVMETVTEPTPVQPEEKEESKKVPAFEIPQMGELKDQIRDLLAEKETLEARNKEWEERHEQWKDERLTLLREKEKASNDLDVYEEAIEEMRDIADDYKHKALSAEEKLLKANQKIKQLDADLISSEHKRKQAEEKAEQLQVEANAARVMIKLYA